MEDVDDGQHFVHVVVLDERRVVVPAVHLHVERFVGHDPDATERHARAVGAGVVVVAAVVQGAVLPERVTVVAAALDGVLPALVGDERDDPLAVVALDLGVVEHPKVPERDVERPWAIVLRLVPRHLVGPGEGHVVVRRVSGVTRLCLDGDEDARLAVLRGLHDLVGDVACRGADVLGAIIGFGHVLDVVAGRVPRAVRHVTTPIHRLPHQDGTGAGLRRRRHKEHVVLVEQRLSPPVLAEVAQARSVDGLVRDGRAVVAPLSDSGMLPP